MPHRLGPFDKELASATTLPAFASTDPAILAAEQARIFRRGWEPIGTAVDVDAPGTDEAVARTVAFSHGIQLEDIGICEAVQKGLASGAYERRRFAALRENARAPLSVARARDAQALTRSVVGARHWSSVALQPRAVSNGSRRCTLRHAATLAEP